MATASGSKTALQVDYEKALSDAAGDKFKTERVKLKHQLNVLRGQLELGRSTFRSHWLDLAYHIAPRRARFLISDVNRGDKRMQVIIKNTAGRALRTLRAGMMSACTSPTRPWFRIEPINKELAKVDRVKQWCYEVTTLLQALFSRTNFYKIMPILYGDGATFATGVSFVEEDMDSVARFYTLPIGSFSIARDAKGRVNTLCRDWRMTVRSVVETFATSPTGEIDWTKVSGYVKSQWENGNFQTWCDICHFILPNAQYRANALGIKGFPFLSIYFERGGANTGGGDSTSQAEQVLPMDQFLRIRGYHHAPVLDFVWESTGEDDYGTSSPGMEALADIRSQQLVMRRTFQAMEYKLRPPLAATVGMKQQLSSVLPGDIKYANNPADLTMKPIYEVEFDIKDALAFEESIKNDVNEAFLTDLFRMMLDDDRRMPPTAQEVSERKQEGLLQLGPVMQSLNDGVLDPAVMMMFNFAMQQGRLPQPPPELHGQGLGIEYISLMAQAMKLMGVAGLDRLMGFLNQLGQISPQAMDVFDTDEMGRAYADSLSVPPMIVRPEDKVAQVRAQRQQASQQQAQQQAAQQHAETAKTLASAPTDQPNMLTELMNQQQQGNPIPQR